MGDVLTRMDARSQVIAISGKGRGSILPAGKTGTAYMYMEATGQFASSSFGRAGFASFWNENALNPAPDIRSALLIQ